jgi:predicted phosphodiesterase
LEAVLSDLQRQAPREVLVAGDLVGRGPDGSAVVQRLARTGWRGVRGNHEDYLLHFRRGPVPEEWQKADHWAASRWMAAELTDSDAAYIDSLPFTLVSGLVPEIRLVHGSPASHSEGLGPWCSDESLKKHLDSIREPILVCAHTHRPLLRQVDTAFVVNVGSVGLPFNRDQRAQYAILHVDGDRCDVEFRQVEYDRDLALSRFESSGFLAQGGVTAQLLRMELEEAVPFLVPFLMWARASGHEPLTSQIPRFLQFYEPGRCLESFVRKVRRLEGGEVSALHSRPDYLPPA